MTRDTTCAASPAAPCSSATWFARDHACCGLPAFVVLLGSSAACLPRPHLRGQPACVVCLGPLAPCAASPLPRPLGPSAPCAANTLPRPLGPMRS
ncbi:hypothetical protein C4D60_Mb05t20790 [Musa balbisiana]|uniref:Uncharacterized protein n=1 Tax=Musa balbisiana TaxID=52838 RepID=A0A4S8JXN8_MUSBA|nr:hypothetical protein C4D60_Mb05t20790 [Musa balbisiana]